MKELQNGRSMIEMLGVLAIIGVLSIGGLAGYTMAMNRHRANTILDYASRVAVSVQTVGQGNVAVTDADCKTYLENEAYPSATSNCKVTFTPIKDTVEVTFTIDNTNVKNALENRLNGTSGVTFDKTAGKITYAPAAS